MFFKGTDVHIALYIDSAQGEANMVERRQRRQRQLKMGQQTQMSELTALEGGRNERQDELSWNS